MKIHQRSLNFEIKEEKIMKLGDDMQRLEKYIEQIQNESK